MRTVFNVLGPLTNPAGATRQLLGVYSDRLVRPVADVLQQLGSERAWVVHGRDGLDELTVFAQARTSPSCADGEVREFELDPGRVRARAHRPQRRGGRRARAENAARMRAVLAGEKGAARNIVVLNAAAALVVAGVVRHAGGGHRARRRRHRPRRLATAQAGRAGGVRD